MSEFAWGLVGKTLSHSHSPAIHEMLGSYPYDLLEVRPEDIRDFLVSKHYRGLNVTIPYKKIAAEVADERSDIVKRLGNANTLVRMPSGKLFADNTDYRGFSYQLDSIQARVEGRVCLILGDGAAASTVRAVLEDRGAAEVLNASRHGSLRLSAFGFDPPKDISSDEAQRAARICSDVSLIVNATPYGMYPQADVQVLVDLDRFPSLRYVFDLVYNPLKTALVQEGRARGLSCASGLRMLVGQAKCSSELFLQTNFNDDVLDTIYQAMIKRLRVISLIGMPGCGKSSTAKHLAFALGYDLVDIDEMISACAQKSISDIFAQDGETEFRRLETRCCAEATSRGGRVIACGGGVVTRPENRFYLKQNGPVILLTRGLIDDPADPLPTFSRPLSLEKGLLRIREERAELYHAWADMEVGPSTQGPAYTARRIARMVENV